jgi:recombinational DNA repair protein (RecF pathway)
LINALGIMPDTEECSFCQKKFNKLDLSLLDIQNGGFVCIDCASKRDEFLSDNRMLSEEYQRGREQRNLLGSFSRKAYKEYSDLDEVNRGNVVVSFNYLNYQFGFTESDYKTWKLVFE